MNKARENKTPARRNILQSVTVASLLVLFPISLLADAAKFSVSIEKGFDPATITIHVGDSVTWTNDSDSDQDVTADDNSFSSGNLKSGKTYSHTFSTVGKFPYGCSIHPRERGAVVVEK